MATVWITTLVTGELNLDQKRWVAGSFKGPPLDICDDYENAKKFADMRWLNGYKDGRVWHTETFEFNSLQCYCIEIDTNTFGIIYEYAPKIYSWRNYEYDHAVQRTRG